MRPIRVPRWLVCVRAEPDGSIRFAIGEAGSDESERELVRGAFEAGCAFVVTFGRKPSRDEVDAALTNGEPVLGIPGARSIIAAKGAFSGGAR